MSKSLKALGSELADPLVQLQCLDQPGHSFPAFQQKLAESDLYPLKPTRIEILQVNVGKLCNQTCQHCHVDAGPDRQEVMSRATLELCLEVLRRSDVPTVDVTGGAPEMNPDFEWFLEELIALGRQVMVRSNLTILTKPAYQHLCERFAEGRVKIVASLPCYTAANTDQQRGNGVFSQSIQAIRTLNTLGYGREGTGLELNLVYNPLGPNLPGPQKKLEADYRRVLLADFGAVFNHLFCITNMPISRFLDFLLRSGRYESYMETLVNAYNPAAAEGVMCRHTLSVGWDGSLYDCDFNQMLELKVEASAPQHIGEFDLERLSSRRIVLNQHCFGCTAGAGSSCGGEITP